MERPREYCWMQLVEVLAVRQVRPCWARQAEQDTFWIMQTM